MPLFQTTDIAGFESIHECANEEIAKQLHLLHYGLLSIAFRSVENQKGNISPCFEPACLEYADELEHSEMIK